MRNSFQEHIGVGERQVQYGRHAGGTNTTPVVADDGLLRGKKVGEQTERWSGRVDAKVQRGVTHVNPNLIARREEL